MTPKELAEWKIFKREVIKGFVRFKIIPQDLVGQINLHVTQSGLGDIDVFEKGVLRRLERDTI